MFRKSFVEAIRWWLIVMGVAIGTTALMIAEETGAMNPVFFSLLGYGYAYIAGSLWKEMRGRILGWSIGIYFFLTILSSFIDDILYILFAMQVDINKFFVWMAMLTVIGIPVMTVVFRRVRH